MPHGRREALRNIKLESQQGLLHFSYSQQSDTIDDGSLQISDKTREYSVILELFIQTVLQNRCFQEHDIPAPMIPLHTCKSAGILILPAHTRQEVVHGQPSPEIQGPVVGEDKRLKRVEITSPDMPSRSEVPSSSRVRLLSVHKSS